MSRITVYVAPDDAHCFGCTKTVEKFAAAGVEHDTVVLDKDLNPEAYAYVTEKLGYRQAPVVDLGDGDHWSGLQKDRIDRVIRDHGIAVDDAAQRGEERRATGARTELPAELLTIRDRAAVSFPMPPKPAAPHGSRGTTCAAPYASFVSMVGTNATVEY